MKRFIDLSFSVLGLLFLSPVILITALLVRSKLGSPVFFKQSRPGFEGKTFELVKFRTMTDSKDANGDLLDDSLRLTAFGRFLRSSSLDELPGLWNVLIGEMSLVGPRPLLIEYLDYYTFEQSLRHKVRPGLTGWAQVNGRNAISWEDKFSYDVWYVKNHSLMLDLKIIILTVWKVFCREGITAAGEATMPKFTGSKN